MGSINIQYVSDIHLEHYDFQEGEPLYLERWIRPVPGAAALVLAGDIGWPGQQVYHDFLAAASSRWPEVILIAGNHEFYQPGTTVAGTLDRLRGLAAVFPNVHFLERESLELGRAPQRLRVIGATLWSDLSNSPEIVLGLNDFWCIRVTPGGARLTPAEYTSWHLRDRTWLRNQLAAARDSGEEVLVVTHHMPSFRLIAPKYQGNPYNACFASNLDDMIEEFEPASWICGHSHSSNRIRLGRTQLALNPLGYPEEDGAGGSPGAALQLKS